MWGFSGALSPYWQLFESPVCGGFARFLLSSWGMWGISRGFVLIQDDGDHSHKDFWEYFSTWERTQVFIGICGIRRIVMQIYTSINLGHRFKKANASILRCRWFFVPLLSKYNFSERFNIYGVLWLKLSLNLTVEIPTLPFGREPSVFREYFRPPVFAKYSPGFWNSS